MPETGNPKWIALTRASIVIGLAAMVALLFVIAWYVTDSHQRDQDSALVRARIEDQVMQIAALTAQIKSCTDPAGACYQRDRDQTANLVGNPHGPINTVIVLTAACTDRTGVQTDQEIFACVGQKLQTLAKKGDKPR